MYKNIWNIQIEAEYTVVFLNKTLVPWDSCKTNYFYGFILFTLVACRKKKQLHQGISYLRKTNSHNAGGGCFCKVANLKLDKLSFANNYSIIIDKWPSCQHCYVGMHTECSC